MRLLGIGDVSSGMKLGKNMYGQGGVLLLRQGTLMQESYIASLGKLGYPGTYVQDDFSSDVDVPEILDDDLRRQCMDILHTLFAERETPPNKGAIYASKISKAVDGIIDAVLRTRGSIINLRDLKVYDEYVIYHSINVTIIALSLAVEMGFTPDQLHELGVAAILHDVGVRTIDKALLAKKGNLSPEEMVRMRRHSQDSYELMKNTFRTHTTSYVAVLQHHERFDGQGYPKGTKGQDIHRYARILAVADVYDAISSKRPYHDAYPPSEAYEYISANSGAHFDAEVVRVFGHKIAPYPMGSMVKLSDGRQALILGNRPQVMMRPKIRVMGPNGENAGNIDLASDKEAMNITIVGTSV